MSCMLHDVCMYVCMLHNEIQIEKNVRQLFDIFILFV